MISTRFCPVCGAANEETFAACFACGHLLASGSTSPDEQNVILLQERYQIGDLLGSGGFSVVHRARDMREDGREVAIKQINLQGLNAEETIEATDTFNREVKLLSTLHHLQVPDLYDHFNDPNHWYLVLEYLEGTTLEVYLERRAAQGKPIKVDEALAMTLQLCVVLDYLHTCQPPVIFRDLKPGNIIRTPGGKLCLIDFGIARHYRPGQARDTQRLGSPGYAAPEQYGRAQTTPRADIYSLGALLHALISGQDPAKQPGGLPPLRLHSTLDGPRLASLIQRMLSPDPNARPATVREVADELTDIRQQRANQSNATRIWQPPIPQTPLPGSGQQQIQVPNQPASPTQRPPRSRTSRRNALIGLGTLAVVAGGSFWWIKHIQAPSYPYVYHGHAGSVNGVAWSPDSRRVASTSDDGTVQVWDASNGDNALIYQKHKPESSNVIVTALAWEPAGRYIASGADDIQVWGATSGNVFAIHPGRVKTLAWSPDNMLIASTPITSSEVQVWLASNGGGTHYYNGHYSQVNALSWSPNGQFIASASGDTTVQIWNALTDDLKQVLIYRKHLDMLQAVAWSPSGVFIASADRQEIHIWNAQNGLDILSLQRGTNTLAWSPDSKYIASTDGNAVTVWDTGTGADIMAYTGHADLVTDVAWSPDGKLIASSSLDGSAQVWNAPGH